MGIKDKLIKTHSLFLQSVKSQIEGEFLVGSLAYMDEKFLREESDLDIVCVINPEKVGSFLKTKYLKNVLSPKDAKKILDENITDYLVLKTKINGILLSIDVIPEKFFNKMCNIKLAGRKRSYKSHKYGNEPQTNSYDIYNFFRKKMIIKKKSDKIFGGYKIELPLFTIYKNNYYHGIPTAKMLTSKIYFDPHGIVKKNIVCLFRSILKRLSHEINVSSEEQAFKLFTNILKKRNKLSFEAREIIKKEIQLSNLWK